MGADVGQPYLCQRAVEEVLGITRRMYEISPFNPVPGALPQIFPQFLHLGEGSWMGIFKGDRRIPQCGLPQFVQQSAGVLPSLGEHLNLIDLGCLGGGFNRQRQGRLITPL